VNLIEDALRAVADSEADVGNLSFGKRAALLPLTPSISRHPLTDVYRGSKWAESLEVPPGMRNGDATILLNTAAGELIGWRDLMDIPQSSIGHRAAAVADVRKIVIAAAGDLSNFIVEPAGLPKIFSAGFNRPTVDAGGIRPLAEERIVFDLHDKSCVPDLTGTPPYPIRAQTGSCVAAPLFTGFAALMVERIDLGSYREAMR